VVASQQVTRAPVVFGPERERALVTEPVRSERAVDNVRKQQCDDLAHPVPGERAFSRSRQGYLEQATFGFHDRCPLLASIDDSPQSGQLHLSACGRQRSLLAAALTFATAAQQLTKRKDE